MGSAATAGASGRREQRAPGIARSPRVALQAGVRITAGCVAGGRGDHDRRLEADPWCFRSGYMKAELMTALANVPLNDDDRRRLQGVVRRRLRRPEPGLLRPTGRLAANVWDDELADEVNRFNASGSAAEKTGAEAVVHAVQQKRKTIAGQRTND